MQPNRLNIEEIKNRFGVIPSDTIKAPFIDPKAYFKDISGVQDNYKFINKLSRLKHSDYLTTYQSKFFETSEFKSAKFTEDGQIQMKKGSSQNHISISDKICTPYDFYYSLLFEEDNFFSIIILHIYPDHFHSGGQMLTLNTFSRDGKFISQEIVASEAWSSLVGASTYNKTYTVLEGDKLIVHFLEILNNEGIETRNTKQEVLIFDKNGFITKQ